MRKVVLTIGTIIVILIFLCCIKENKFESRDNQKDYSDRKIVIQSFENDFPEAYYENFRIERLNIPLQKIENMIFHENEVLQKEQYSNGNNVLYTISNSDGEILNYNSNNLRYYTKEYQKISQYFGVYPNSELNNEKKYNKKVDLSFASQREAYNEICKALKKIDVPIEKFSYECLVIDYNSLKQIEKEYNKSENKIKETDECYFFSFRQKVDSYPLINYYLNTYTELMIGTSQIQLIYSKRGIEYLYIDKLYDIEFNNKKKLSKSFENIKNKVIYKYKQLLNLAIYKVDKIEFAYFILEKRNKAQCIPVWIITITEKGDNTSQTYQEMYDALSEEEIVL